MNDTNQSAVNYSAAEKLAESIRVMTVSHMDSTINDMDEILNMHRLLERLFPLVHEKLEKSVINSYSLIYLWKSGKEASPKKPILFTAHMDVVPVDAETEKEWEHGPFSGDISDGFVWGRGALDIKIQMISVLEAAERLLEKDFTPDRDIWFAFGHDEEVGGREGAKVISEHFSSLGLEFDFVIDEGGCVTEGVMEQVAKPVALIGVGEKGYANIRLTVTGEGGHTSMPPVHSALGLLSQVICRLESNQCKTRLIKPVEEFLKRAAPHMNWLYRFILSNLWLFKPVFISIFSRSKTGNALLRTTIAATMANASMLPNVLPQRASAVINSRILPGETGEDIINHIKKVTAGISLDIEILLLEEPSCISPSDTVSFAAIESNIKKLYPDAIVAPYVVLAGTDARKYEIVSRNVYRFSPYMIHDSELAKIHGTNENISIENISHCVEFFISLMLDMAR